MGHSSFRGPRIVLLALTVAAAAQAAPLQPNKPLPGPIGPAVPKPPPAPAGDCLTATADIGWGVGGQTFGQTTGAARSHEKDCPDSVIVDITVNPEAAPAPSPGIAFEVGDSRESLAGGDLIILPGGTTKKACEDFKHSQKIYRRNEGDAASLLVAQGGTEMLWHDTLRRCAYRRPNHAFRAPASPAGKKTYYRLVDTFTNGPTGTVTVKFRY